MNNMFKRIKNKCATKLLNQYPCDIYLKNALHFISIEQPSDAYEEICYAIIRSGGELSDEERRTFEMLRQVNK